MSCAGFGKPDDGDFLLVLSGSTRYAPYLAGWQDFKDHIRKIVKDHPGWVDVDPGPTQRRGEMQVWARLRLEEDANASFKTFCRSKGMLVHIYKTARSSEGYRLLRCNCSSHFPEVSDGDHSAGRCGIDARRLLGAGRAVFAATAAQYLPAQPAYGYSYPATHYTIPAVSLGYGTPSQVPVYSSNPTGLPVNVRRGAVLTEARGIFIQNLSYKCTPTDLQSLLLTVGQPVEYHLMRDPRTNAFKGTATAKFYSKEYAQHAATYLNGREHMGMKLMVRMDKETTAVGQTGPPLIVRSDMYRC